MKPKRRMAPHRHDPTTISKFDLDHNVTADLSLGFNPHSPNLAALHDLCKQFVDALISTPLPKGLTHPIAKGPQREPASWRNVECLMANTLRMRKKGKRTVSISLRRNTYSGSRVTPGFINLAKLAAHPTRQMLILKEGFRDMIVPSYSRQARIKPTRKFDELLDTIIVRNDDWSPYPPALVNLRKTVVVKGKTRKVRGKTVKTKGTRRKQYVPESDWDVTPEKRRELDDIRNCLEWFNLALAEVEITYIKAADDEKHYLYPILYAVYTDDFDHGGRLYTKESGHQALSQMERSTIRIDGTPTVELDFGGLHVRMLYHLAGKAYPVDACPYAGVLEEMGLDADEVKADAPEVYADLKRTLLALINGKGSQGQAIVRAHRRLFESWRGEYGEMREEEKEKVRARRKRWEFAGLDPSMDGVAEVIKAFRRAHKPIRDSFAKGVGLHLQNLDARIARFVLMEMIAETPVLPLHDSFITIRSEKKRLRGVMQEVYQAVMQEVTGSKTHFDIPITTKKR